MLPTELADLSTHVLETITGGAQRITARGNGQEVAASITALKGNIEELARAQANKSSSSDSMMPMMMMMMMKNRG